MRKMKDTFKKDLSIGEEAEKMVLSMVRKKYPEAFKIEGNFKYYDLYVPEKAISIEVKRDIGSNDTENYFIECKCNGYNSGIFASRSDYYVIFDENRFIWIRTDKLRSISKIFGKRWVGIPKGCKSEVKAYLLDKEYVVYYSEKITKLP